MQDDVPPRRLARAEAILAARRRDVTIVLEDTYDPHNMSAVLRTSEALGIQDVHLVSQRGVLARVNKDVAIGAQKWLTLHEHESAADAIRTLRERACGIFVSHLSPDAVPLPELPRPERAAYVFGNERDGVSPEWIEHSDACFLIPTTGFTGSLNLSVAVALTLYDRLRVHAPSGLETGNLSERERAELRATWYRRLAHGSAELERTYAQYLDDPPPARRSFPNDRNAS